MPIPTWLRTAEVAAVIGCSMQTVYELIACGELEAWRISDGGPWKIERASVHQFIAALYSEASRDNNTEGRSEVMRLWQALEHPRRA